MGGAVLPPVRRGRWAVECQSRGLAVQDGGSGRKLSDGASAGMQAGKPQAVERSGCGKGNGAGPTARYWAGIVDVK